MEQSQNQSESGKLHPNDLAVIKSAVDLTYSMDLPKELVAAVIESTIQLHIARERNEALYSIAEQLSHVEYRLCGL